MGAWLGAGLTGLSFLSSLFGKKQHNEVDKTTTSTPTYDDQNLGFRNFLINAFQNQVSSTNPGSDFENSYRTGGLNNIRMQSNNANKAIDDIISSRGLGRTTAGGSALANTSVSNSNSIASFLNNLPIVMDQRREGILRDAGGYQSAIPVGSTTHVKGYDDTTGGGGIGAGISGASSGLAGYLGQLSANNSLQKILATMGKSSGGGGSGKSWSPGSPYGDKGSDGEGWS